MPKIIIQIDLSDIECVKTLSEDGCAQFEKRCEHIMIDYWQDYAEEVAAECDQKEVTP